MFLAKNKKLLFLFIVILTVIGVYLVRKSTGVASITWMNVFKVYSFNSPAKVVEYVKNLMVPIPILISLSEIVAHNVFGNVLLITQVFYRIAMVLCFILALYLASPSRIKLSITFVFCVIFLWSTVIVHRGNPVVYDIFFPLFNLLYFFFLETASHPSLSRHPKLLVLLCLAAGFFLSMTELTRPYVFLLLPLFIFCAYQTLRDLPRRYFIFFLLPLILFSGIWHTYIALQHGQITWTNHSGFNLYRAWLMVKLPELVTEVNNRPLAKGSWNNLNTPEHYENSQRIQKAILTFIWENPKASFSNVIARLSKLLKVKTSIYKYKPRHWVLELYVPCFLVACCWLFFNALLFGIGIITRKDRLQILGIPENLLIIVVVLYLFILAIGESGEEARFLISVLPLIAVLPNYCIPLEKGTWKNWWLPKQTAG